MKHAQDVRYCSPNLNSTYSRGRNKIIAVAVTLRKKQNKWKDNCGKAAHETYLFLLCGLSLMVLNVRKKLTLIMFGACLIAGALLYFLSALGFISLSFSAWWTLFLVVPALADMIVRKVQVWNSFLLVVGLWFFIREQRWEWLGGRILDALAVTLAAAALGTLLIARGLRGSQSDLSVMPNEPGYVPQHNPRTDSLPRPSYNAVFSGGEYKNICPVLENVQLSGIFGTVDLDLSAAGIIHNAVIEVNSFFGSVTVRMPQNVNVHFEGTSVFGGVENHLVGAFNPNIPTVRVKYFTMFGGANFRY